MRSDLGQEPSRAGPGQELGQGFGFRLAATVAISSALLVATILFTSHARERRLPGGPSSSSSPLSHLPQPPSLERIPVHSRVCVAFFIHARIHSLAAAAAAFALDSTHRTRT